MQDHDFIKLEYSGKVKETGLTLDKPQTTSIVVGAGYVLPGIDEALKQINLGEKKTVTLTPDKAFGAWNQELVRLFPLNEFKRHGTDPYPGMIVEGDNMRGRVLSVSGGRVRVDFNHSLAGKTLIYDLEIKGKIDDIKEKIKAIIDFYTKLDKTDVHIHEKEVEIFMPKTFESVLIVYKKKVADDVMNFLGFEKVKFSEVFEKTKEEDSENGEKAQKSN